MSKESEYILMGLDVFAFILAWGVYYLHGIGEFGFESSVLLMLILIWVRIGTGGGDSH